MSLYIHQGDFLRFPLLTSESYSGKNIMQYMLCSGACLLFDLANTWEAFYKLIIPQCIHNVLKKIIKMPTQGSKINILTSSLNVRLKDSWRCWDVETSALCCELRNAVGPQHIEPSGFIFIFSTEIWIYGLILTELWSTCSADRGGNKAADM